MKMHMVLKVAGRYQIPEIVRRQVGRGSDDVELPGGIGPNQALKRVQGLVEAFVDGKPADGDEALLRHRRRGVMEFRQVDTIFDEARPGWRQLAEHLQIVVRAAGNPVVEAGGQPGHGVEPDLLETAALFGMKKAAVGGRDQFPAVKRLCQRQRIEKEIDRMHMDQVGLAETGKDRRCKRIAAAAVKTGSGEPEFHRE